MSGKKSLKAAHVLGVAVISIEQDGTEQAVFNIYDSKTLRAVIQQLHVIADLMDQFNDEEDEE